MRFLYMRKSFEYVFENWMPFIQAFSSPNTKHTYAHTHLYTNNTQMNMFDALQRQLTYPFEQFISIEMKRKWSGNLWNIFEIGLVVGRDRGPGFHRNCICECIRMDKWIMDNVDDQKFISIVILFNHIVNVAENG